MPRGGIEPPVALVRTLQIIIAAMAAGCVVFLIVAIAVAGVPGNLPGNFTLTYIVLAIVVPLVLARVIVPRIVVAQARRKIREGTWTAPQGNLPVVFGDPAAQNSDAGKLAIVLMTRTIIAAAILEGATFFVLTAYLVERSPLCLALAVILIVALAAHFPTASSCSAWIEEQTRLLDEERSF